MNARSSRSRAPTSITGAGQLHTGPALWRHAFAVRIRKVRVVNCYPRPAAPDHCPASDHRNLSWQQPLTTVHRTDRTIQFSTRILLADSFDGKVHPHFVTATFILLSRSKGESLQCLRTAEFRAMHGILASLQVWRTLQSLGHASVTLLASQAACESGWACLAACMHSSVDVCPRLASLAGCLARSLHFSLARPLPRPSSPPSPF